MRPKKVVLVVDGDDKELSLRRFLLETRGYRVLTAASGSEALAMVGEMPPGALDLLLCDLAMNAPSLTPDMDGNEIVRRAKDLQPELRTMITSRTMNGFGLALACDVFLSKAANIPAELLDRVRILVSRKRGPKKKVKSVLDAEIAAAEVAA